MRTIRKRQPPASLTAWRGPRMAAGRPPGTECTYEELRRSPKVVSDIVQALLQEQGGLCAYTGRPIASRPDGDFHVEHLIPQAHCEYGEDADYRNLVACWPRPNSGFEPRYGARRKGDWPPPAEQNSFLSPLRGDCTARFRFNHRGEISASRHDDEGARETIQRLGLNEREITELRRHAIRGALSPRGEWLTLPQCRRLVEALQRVAQAVDNGSNDQLPAYWFALRSAAEAQIRRLGGRA